MLPSHYPAAHPCDGPDRAFGLMQRRMFLRRLGLGSAGLFCLSLLNACQDTSGRPPNFIIIFTDDQGYNDLGVYGSPNIQTPRIDRMASEGIRFTDFYVSPICSPSRASLLTGSYPVRVGLPDVHLYGAPFGLSPDELTIAEVLQENGYATACFGKWHLGQDDIFAPNRQGFDYFYGTRMVTGTQPFENFAAPLFHNDRKITDRPDFFRFTQDYTREAIRFVEHNQNQPFFAYLAHPMPHIPIYPGKEFEGTSQAGLYGDAIEEIDWCTGLLLDRLDELGVDRQTLVIYTSDNGPWLGFDDQSGSAFPLRGGKLTTWEGGVRVPCIMRWPGRIPANAVCRELVTIMDLMPTLAHLGGVSLPPGHVIDGKNIWPLMRGEPNAESPYEVYFYYAGTWLQAVRSGQWKLHLARPEPRPGIYGECAPWLAVNTTTLEADQLFDLGQDVAEQHDVAADHPEIVAQLLAHAEQARYELGDYGRRGSAVRPTGAAHSDYPDPQTWLGSPHWQQATDDLRNDMRAFRQYRFQLLQRETSLHTREQLELQWYLDNPDQLTE